MRKFIDSKTVKTNFEVDFSKHLRQDREQIIEEQFLSTTRFDRRVLVYYTYFINQA